METPLLPLSGRLRGAVRPIHERIERLPFFTSLSARTLPFERYLDQLRAMAIVEATLERVLLATLHPAVAAARDAVPSRLEALLSDLASFDRRGPLPDDPAPAATALGLSRALLLLSVERPAALLGPFYVSTGMTLGNLVHLEDARACAGGGGTGWYEGHGAGTAPAFRRLCAVLDGLTLAPGEAAAAIDAAESFAAGLERMHAVIDPSTRPLRRFLATTLNPEAGAHPVPADPSEMAAALRAGARCLEEHPYFLSRYGERGRRFTGSDAAWLVSLTALPPSEVSGQVGWLASVLSRKGMPSLLLERQLVLLAEELRAGGVPRDGGVLESSARSLADRRREALPEEVAARLAGTFVASSGHGPEEERRAAADLLLAAVADEAAGLAGTVRAVTEWFRGPRYPGSWNEAVDVLVRDALAAAARRGPEGPAG